MKLAPKKREEISSATITQALGLILACSAICVLTAYASPPAWWSSRGAIHPPVVTTNDGVVTTNYALDDTAAVTQGQLKQFTVKAVDELNADLTNYGGAGATLTNLVYGWQQDYATNDYSNPTNPFAPYNPRDFTAMTVGQLKGIAGLVYGRLSAAGYTELTPSWLHQNTNTDSIVAAIGQLKQVFDFDLSLPSVSSLTATDGASGTINLNWTLPSTNNVTSWLIEEQATSGAWDVITNLTNPDATNYEVTGLTNGESYNFQVIGSGTNSVSTPAEASGTPSGTAPVPVPMVVAGEQFALALRADGTVWSWGEDLYGQLGNGSALGHNSPTSPVQVSGLTQVVMIAAGFDFGYALRSDGTVWAWGDNNNGELGNGTTVSSDVPVQVAGLTGIVAVSAGYDFGFAVKSDGTVWAWGENGAAQLGIGTYTYPDIPITAPVQVSVISGVVAVSAGYNTSLALKSDGTVWSWGGIGTTSEYPTQVSGLSSIQAISTCPEFATFNLALKSDGTVWAWGTNTNGQLGNGTTTSSSSPVEVSDLTGIVAVGAGPNHAVAEKNDGTVWTWGSNAYDTLGNGTSGGTTYQSTVPIQASTPPGIIGVAAGDQDGFALRVDGSISGWGSSAYGGLGVAASPEVTPTQIPDFTLKSLLPYGMSVGDAHSLAYRSDGTLFSWGNDASGQLGNWTEQSSSVPSQNKSLSGVVTIAAGTSFSSAIEGDGSIWTWGTNSLGQLGNGTTANSSAPVKDASISGVLMTATGASHTVVIKNDDTVWTWGNNNHGQLGNGNTTNQNTPVEVTSSGLNGSAFQVAAGSAHSVALKSDGTIWTWGDNQYGQLGNGTTSDSSSPIELTGLTGIFVSVAAGASHTVALCADGTVWAWGYNGDGELGNGSTSNSTSPVQISDFDNVVAVAATASNTYALKADGTLWAWGANNLGQLGIGSTTGSTSPVQVSGLNNVIALATGSSANHMLAMKVDGSVWGWGDNLNGDLGDGTSTQRNAPVQTSNVNLMQFPSVTLTNLVNSTFNASSSIPLGVTVNAPSGSVTEVNYYADGILVGSQTSFPFIMSWNNVSAGTYAITAVATDANGATTASAPIDVTVLTSGYSSVCANNNDSFVLRSDGTVWAWGENSAGELGVGPTSEQLGPAWVAGLNNVISLAAGGAHAVALTSTGTVWTWGDNVDGNLGLGTSTSNSVPQQVSSLSGILGVAAGTNHVAVLAADGTVWTWGDNTYGQLGTGNNTSSSTPVQINPATLSGVIAIAAANYQTMALKADGTVWMWGTNAQGQLGNGTTTTSFNVPTQVSSLTGILSISCGNEHAAAVTNTGHVYIWGDNSYGELGNSTTTQSNSPILVSSLSNISSVFCGNGVSLAIGSSGTTYAWGNNASGQLGLESTTSSFTTPQTASNWSGMTQFACGTAHTLGSKSDGTVWSTGSQSYCQLGNGVQSSSNVDAPLEITSLIGYLGISDGDAHTLAVKSDGTVWAWGNNAVGQLGIDSTTSSSAPVQTSVISNAVAVSAGSEFSLALGSDGTVWAWGSNSVGQLGVSTTFTSVPYPSPVSGVSGVMQVSAGGSFGVALAGGGTVWDWGAGGQGELGNGSTANSSVPVQATGLSGVIQVAAGSQHVVALQSGGTVWTWGNNGNGELGNNSTTNSSTPGQISTSYLSDIVEVAAGTNFSVALKNDGTVWTWGYNGEGELGLGTTTQSLVPVQVTGVSNVVAITAGASQVFALESNGTLYTWGLNSNGQLGVGSTTNSHSPVQVTGAPSGIVYFADGSSSNHSVVITANNSVYAWGDNASGDLGDGTTTQRTSPVIATDVSTGPMTYTVAPAITLTEPDGATLLP